MEHHHVSWVNSLFLWAIFNSFLYVYQAGYNVQLLHVIMEIQPADHFGDPIRGMDAGRLTLFVAVVHKPLTKQYCNVLSGWWFGT